MADLAPSPEERARSPDAAGVRAPDRTGQCIRERYLVEATIGKGGMAVVYRAKDLATGRSIALKQLTHPRIIEVYAFGVEEQAPFYTMELLDGGDLRERCPLNWTDACAVAYDICSSLALLHSRRLVHRDVSPRNVRCTRDGLAKLI